MQTDKTYKDTQRTKNLQKPTKILIGKRLGKGLTKIPTYKEVTKITY
jgi:hypothetical protein